MTTLVIAEKSSVASDIAKALGGFTKSGSVFERDDLLVTNAVGHLVKLEVRQAADAARGFPGLPIIPEQFDLEVIEQTRSQYLVIEKLLRRSDVTCVINACDAGREGELIFRLIMAKANCNKPTKRMWCQSMTHEALCKAFDMARPGDEYDNLYMAARCRSEADWLIGINGSRGIMSLREQQTGRRESSSAGRVQSPTLAIIVDRENEINSFVPQDFWEVVGTFGVVAGQYKGKWKGKSAPVAEEGEKNEEAADAARSRFFDRSQAMGLLQRCQGMPVDQAHEVAKPTTQPPPRLLDLTSLQREANRRFKFSVKKTLGIAQALYEKHKMTTYPRTDSSCLPEDYIDTAGEVMRKLEVSPWGRLAKPVTDSGWIKPNKRIFDNSKISDHFAIIPTGVLSDQLDQDERLVYELIVRRFIAAFYPNAEFISTKRVTVVAGESFHSSGKVLIHAGWLSVLQEVDEDGQLKKSGDAGLCALQEGELPTNQGVEVVAGRTAPPSRYTEASLLTAMETAGKNIEDEEMRAAMKDKGLGTPATRSTIIETLLDDGKAYGKPREPYVVRDKTFLVPTPKGSHLVGFLRECGAGFLVSAQTTGEWEGLLNRMARGEYGRDEFMDGIRQTTRDLIATLQDESRKVPQIEASTLRSPCPKCGASVLGLPGAFRCSSSCGFERRREVAGRPLSDAEMEKLLKGETVHGLNGFYSPKKKANFSAGLKYDETGELTFVFPEASANALKCKCPKCDGAIAAKPMIFECGDCEFKVWREMAGRKFSDTEMERLMQKGSLDGLKGFVSKAKKKFDAGVKLNMDGKIDFVFAPR